MTTSRETHTRHSTQLLGTAGLALIAIVCGLLIATYQKAFKPVVHVTVRSDRAGLLLDKGARVRLSGVPVGEVRSTDLQPDGTVKIDVALDDDKAGKVPADVSASIRATTVFGSKFVDLRVRKQSIGRAVAAGDVITADDVTIEANDVFAHAIKVLDSVDATKLNSTLTAMSTAIDGRGEKFGQFFSDWDHYLKQVNGHLPALEADLRSSAEVFGTYADAAPALIDTASNLGKTSATLVANAKSLDEFLSSVVVAAGSAEALLRGVAGPLVAFNREWLPVTTLGAEYAPGLGCLVHDLHHYVKVFDRFFGGAGDHAFYAHTGFLPSQDPYTLADNRPKLVRGVGPVCYQDDPTPAHVNFDDGTAGVYSPDATGQPVGPPENPVALYYETLRSWFGESGANAFLQELTKETRK